MPTCQCGTTLEGRRRKCDACKAGPNKTGPAKPPPAPVAQADATPAGLHDRGRQLWADLGLALNTPAGQIALEACRLADRLDELDSVIAGKGVLNLMAFRLHFDGLVADAVEGVIRDRDDVDVRVDFSVDVKFQSVLTEARGQQALFAALLGAIKGQVTATAQPAPAAKAAASSPLDELARRRQGTSTK